MAFLRTWADVAEAEGEQSAADRFRAIAFRLSAPAPAREDEEDGMSAIVLLAAFEVAIRDGDQARATETHTAILSHIRSLRSRVATLEAELKEAREDVDYLEEHPRLVIEPDDLEWGSDIVVFRVSGINDRQFNEVGRGKTVRDAIRAARKPEARLSAPARETIGEHTSHWLCPEGRETRLTPRFPNDAAGEHIHTDNGSVCDHSHAARQPRGETGK